MKQKKTTTILLLLNICCAQIICAQSFLKFDIDKLEYEGSPQMQASMLMRKVHSGGRIDANPAALDENFANRLGTPVQITKEKLQNYLSKNNIGNGEIGGSIYDPLSFVSNNKAGRVYARYFAIHDTAFPHYGYNDFPNHINSSAWQWNNIYKWWKSRVTNIFVNRMGASKTVVLFNRGMRGTKFEMKMLGKGYKGLFVHVELIQPRKSSSNGSKWNRWQAPQPGFTVLQYQKLALIYVCASVRRGTWLIPAFHACIDQGIKNAHDDPQNFDHVRWFQAVNDLVAELQYD